METKDKMIGVGIIISDVHQPNEDGEHWNKEKYDERKLGNGAIDPVTRFSYGP